MNGSMDISQEEIAKMDKTNLRMALFKAVHFVAEAVCAFLFCPNAMFSSYVMLH